MALRAGIDSVEFQYLLKVKNKDAINSKLLDLGLEPVE